VSRDIDTYFGAAFDGRIQAMNDMNRESLFKIMHERNSVQRWLARRLFRTVEAAGFHITGDHFYEPIPNTRVVDRGYRDEPRHCAGLPLDLPTHEALACEILERHLPEFLASRVLVELGFEPRNPYYHGFDAALLFAVIRHVQPRRIIEVGQGMSTRVAMAALHRNWQDTGAAATLVTIDPYQRIDAQRPPDGVRVTGHAIPVQEMDLALARELGENDLLFVDSSHVFKFGSDVQFEFETLYPALRPGVLVHVHDIFTPFDYPKAWIVRQKMFWNEQYLLEQFLAFNAGFRILLPSQGLTRLSPRLQRLWREQDGGKGSLAWWAAEPHESASSFYLQRV
jgi:hypothetical protein